MTEAKPRARATAAPVVADAPRTSLIAADAPAAEPLSVGPESGKPVVLATPIGHEFVLPADGDADELHITPAGLALSKADAKRVQDAAAPAGVTLIEKEDS